MSKAETLAAMRQHKLVAVVRTATAEQALAVAQAVMEGGIHLVEITMTVPGALEVLAELAAKRRAMVGAGSVVTPAQAREAIAAGARYIVSPTRALDLLPACREGQAVSVLGALTPTEILEATDAGADLVKVFPVDALGGPTYLQALLAPLPGLKLMPSGGVNLNNLQDYLKLGVEAVALGSALMPTKLVKAGDYAGITERARQFVAAVELGAHQGAVV